VVLCPREVVVLCPREVVVLCPREVVVLCWGRRGSHRLWRVA
jgi:hypothetical protein